MKRLPPYAFTAVVANWLSVLLALNGMRLTATVIVAATITAAPALTRRPRVTQ